MNRCWIPIVLLLTLGCGAAPSAKQGPRSVSTESTMQAGLVAGLKGMHTPKPGEAKVTFALFGGAEFSDGDALNRSIESLVKAELGPLRSHLHRSSRPYIVSTAISQELPIDLETLVMAAARRTVLEKATHVAFVRYSGPRLAKDAHLTATLKVVEDLLVRPEHLVVDMSTRKVFNAEEWSTWSRSEGFLLEQVVPGIEQGPDGITIFTRGMVKFGLPDLEAYGVEQAEARTVFERFQRVLSQLRTREKVSVGDRLEGIELLACRRDERAIEGQCVRLPTPKGGAQ